MPVCTAGRCDVGGCDEGWVDADGSVANGCELNCTPSDAGFEECNDVDDDCDGDADEDGSIGTQYGGDDCNDEDPTIGPHAVEVCDDIDNNCDGLIDEGVTTTFYEDADGDGYGLETSPTEACQKPEGYAQYDGDCIDDDPGINPDATEVCDGLDNDCDGAADEGTKIAIYLDADGDGYGQDPPAGASCADSIPEGWSSEGMDCNDDDDAIHPGAEEICDGVDNDCNSETDELPSCD